jgi:nitroreductase
MRSWAKTHSGSEEVVNDTLRVIRSRRSIRSFNTEQLKREDVELIIAAGLYAPSASNTQNLHYTVIQNQALVEEISGWIVEEVEKSGNDYLKDLVKRSGGAIFRNAPTVIIMSSDGKDRFGVVNAAAATENMLIAAESLGIGYCWIGMIAVLAGSKNIEEYAKRLMLPVGYVLHFGVTLGYKASANPEAPERKPDLVSFIN